MRAAGVDDNVVKPLMGLKTLNRLVTSRSLLEAMLAALRSGLAGASQYFGGLLLGSAAIVVLLPV